jgi:histidyl-tRNA synthetase
LNDGSFKTQFKRADRSDALFALVLGQDEILNDQVTVKFLRNDDNQLTLARNEVGKWIQGYIKAL